MTCLSLFSGIGGIDLAAQWAGFEPVAFVEKESYCQKVLARHWPGVPIYDDVTTFDGTGLRGRVDLVAGGPPCQPVSVAGRRRGAGDERWLWGEYIRIVREAAPRWILAENPPGLLTDAGGRTFAGVVDGLAEVGYRLGWGMWRAFDVGACHLRARVFIVGRRVADLHNGYVDMQGSVCAGWASVIDGVARHPDSEGPQGARSTWPTPDANASNSDIMRPQGREEGRVLQAVGVAGNEPAGSAASGDPCGGGCAREPRRRAGQEPQNGYAPLQGRNWRGWGLEPVVRRGDDGLSSGIHSVNRIKALGNAVVPQQAYPVLKAIADAIRGEA